jgi:cytochrome P450
MRFVWDESIKQAKEMLQSWTGNADPSIASVSKDTRTLSLNVLAATGFRRSYKFHSATQPATEESRTYRDALQTVLDNAILLMLIPPRILRLPFLPNRLARIGQAAADFKQYMVQMLGEEMSLLEDDKTGTGSLMTSFVRALDINRRKEGSSHSDTGQSPSKGLSIDEIFGNIFVINFAGHDTTANTLAFAMLLLSANPEVQDWVGAELQEFMADHDGQKWDYGASFPDLKRCRAVLVRIISESDFLAPHMYSSRHFASTRRFYRSQNGPINTHRPSTLAKQRLSSRRVRWS